MSEEPDYLAVTLHFAIRGRRFLDDSERARFYAMSLWYRTLAIAEGKRFARDMPKRPPALAVKRPTASRQRA